LKDKPLPLGLLSAFLALLPEAIYGASADWYTGSKALPDFRVADFERWTRLFSKPKQIVQALFGYMKFDGLEGFQYNDSVASFFTAASAYAATRDTSAFELIKLPGVPPEEFQTALYTHLLERFEVFASGHAKRVQDNTDTDCSTSMDLPVEVVFLFRVWMGCWVVHHEPFTPLFRRAGNGDVGALEKLVLLDRRILHAPRIAKIWARISEDNESPDFERIHRALAKQPGLVEYDLYEAKANIAGLIAKMSEAFGYPLNASQIGELFDALARDLALPSKRVYRDPDIDRKSDQWRKAVRRNKEKWLESPFF